MYALAKSVGCNLLGDIRHFVDGFRQLLAVETTTSINQRLRIPTITNTVVKDAKTNWTPQCWMFFWSTKLEAFVRVYIGFSEIYFVYKHAL